MGVEPRKAATVIVTTVWSSDLKQVQVA
jgi:hypothetical protein